MPFIDESERRPAFGSLAEASREAFARRNDESSFGEVVGAGFRQENTVFNVYEWLTDERPDLSDPTRSGFDPFTPENLRGYEQHARQFIGVDSMEEMDWLKARLDREEDDDRILASAGPGGMAARMLGGLLDPIMLVPVGGAAAKSYQAGKILKSGLLTMWSAGVGATAAEGILHANQYDRDLGESAWAIGGSLVLGGVIGGGVALLGRRGVARASAEIEEHLNGQRDLNSPNRHQDLPSPVAGGTGDDVLDIPQAMFDEGDALLPGSALPADLEIQKVIGLKTSARMGPWLRTMVRSQSRVARSLMSQMADGPVRTVSHSKGRVGGTKVIREGEPGPIAGRQGTVVTKEQGKIEVGPDGAVDTIEPLVKGIRADSRVDILKENNRSFTVRAIVERKVPAHRVRFEGQPTVVKAEGAFGTVVETPTSRLAPNVRGQIKPGKKGNASESDVGTIADELTTELGRSFSPDELMSALRARGFTGTEAEGAFPVRADTGPETFDVVDGNGEVISSHAKKKDANDAIRAGTTFEVMEESGAVVAGDIATLQKASALARQAGKRFNVVDADGTIVGTHRSVESAHAQADLGFAGEGMVGDLDGVPATVLSREGDDYIVAQSKTMNISKASIRPDHEAPFTPKVVENEDPNFVNVEGRIKLYRAKLGESIHGQREAWYEYRMKLAGKQDSFTARRMLDARERVAGARATFGPGAEPDYANGLSYREFDVEVIRAMRYGDESERIPQVAAPAKAWRDLVFDPMAEAILETKLLPAVIKNEDATSYMMRVYDQQRMKENPVAWDLLVRKWAHREHPNLSEGDITELATAIREKITGAPSGRNPYEGFDEPGLSSPLNHRVFNITDRELDDAGFLINDMEAVGSIYVHSVAPDIELTRTFGDFNMNKQLTELTREYQLREKAITDQKLPEAEEVKAVNALNKERGVVFKDIEAVRDRLRGTFHAPKDPTNFSTRFQRAIRAANVLAHSGGFMISSWPDIWRASMVHGMRRAFGDGLVPLTRSLAGGDIRKMATRELQDAGIGWELVIDSRALSLADIGQDRLSRGTWGEKVLNNAGRNVARVNLLAQWNRGMKQFAGYVTQARMMRAMEGIAEGKITDKEIAKLAEQGISESTALRMAGLARKHGEIEDGFRIAHTDKWAEGLEGEAAAQALGDARLFRAATVREVDKIIVTPGVGDLPLWTSFELGKTIFQYRSFGVASVGRTLLAGLQQGDAAAASGAAMSIGMGAMVAAFKTWEAGKGDEIAEWDFGKWALEGADRSGLFGIYADVHNTMDRVNMGLSRLTGAPHATRFAARNTLSTFVGPSGGHLDTLQGLISAAATGDITQRDIREVRRLMPYQNLFWARSTFDLLEQSFNDTMGIPVRSSRN